MVLPPSSHKPPPQLTLSPQATAIKSIRSLAPLLDRVLVQRMKAEAKTAGGIYLPETAVEKLNEAKVLAVGPGRLDKLGQRMPMSVVSGDKVLIPQVRGWGGVWCEPGSRYCTDGWTVWRESDQGGR